MPDHMATLSVADVVSACQQGDCDAQRALYDEFHRRVFRIALRMVGPNDADDLTQQSFLQIFRKVHQFDHRSQFATWLYRLVTNECLQHLRRRRTRAELPLNHAPCKTCRANSTQLDDNELLQTALERLEPDLRTAFVLREIEELDYRNIAEILEISEGTVASRLNRARKQLKQDLVDLGWIP